MDGGYVGIDVSQERLDVAFAESLIEAFANDETGHNALCARIQSLKPALVVMEASGGLERDIAGVLSAAGIPLRILNARHVRHFAQATGTLAKTDRLDARTLRRFAQMLKPEARALQPEQVVRLQAQMTRRRQLIEMLGMEKNRLRTAHPEVQPNIKASIRWLEKQLRAVDHDIDRLLREAGAWRDKLELLESVPGIARVTSLAVLTALPELGSLNRREISALAGLAPFNRDSGKWSGKRCIYGGRREARSALYMAALVGARYNPALKRFYTRLRDAGKPAKLALTACMRKLLVILNTMLRDRCSWNPLLVPS